jgi:alpha-mannosidase
VAEIDALIADPAIQSFKITARSVDRTHIIFSAAVPGLGWRSLRMRPRQEEAKEPVRIRAGTRLLLPLVKLPFIQKLVSRQKTESVPCSIENEHFKVTVERDGTLTVLDKIKGNCYRGQNRFIDGGDCGDEYNYCPPAHDRLIKGKLKRVTATRGTVRQTLRLVLELPTPLDLAAGRSSRSRKTVQTQIVSEVHLSAGTARVDIHTSVDNQCSDHRLRVHFPGPFKAESGSFDGHFEVVERPIKLPEYDETWVEQPRPEVPQRAFTSITDGRQSLTIANRGLPEVEVLENHDGNAEIALTLLRCVCWLSRDDFANRKNQAGPAMETPGAQMTGKWAFDYAIIPAAERSAPAHQQAYAFNAPVRTATTGAHTGTLGASGSFIAVTPDEFVITTVKTAEDGKGWLVRGYNLSGASLQTEIRPWRAFQHAEKVNLAEEKVDELKIDAEGAVHLPVRAHEIVSMRFWD